MNRITITVLRSGGRDAHGDPSAGTSHVVRNCSVAPRAGKEDDDQGEMVIVGLTLIAPFSADLLATDQVRIDEVPWADTYDVVGEPGRYQSPFTGHRAGLTVALTRHT